MLGVSILSGMLHPRTDKDVVLPEHGRKILQPRTAADELPPYRDQPWIIDRRGYRKVDPGMTLVPASRL